MLSYNKIFTSLRNEEVSFIISDLLYLIMLYFLQAESPPVLVVDMGRSSSRPPSYRKRKNNQYGSHRSLCNEVIAESTENSTECPNLRPGDTSSSPACKRALAKTPEHLRNKPTTFVSPISRSVKKASRCIQVYNFV